MLSIDAALKIPGWMNEDELWCLADLASKSARILEVGSWMGRSTMALAMNTSGTVTAVDTWMGSPEQVHADILAGKDKDWLFREFLCNTQSAKNLMPFRAASLDAAHQLSNQGMTYDLIFIDASHEQEPVEQDILAWQTLLSKNGILCGHDYDRGWPGVIWAVDHLVPNATHPAGAIWQTPRKD
jgi:hypothetical protein